MANKNKKIVKTKKSIIKDSKVLDSTILENEMEKSVLSLSCPYCSSTDFVKRGTRMKKGGKTQLYLCRACKRTFTPVWFKGRQHSWQIILDAMSYYNLGFSLELIKCAKYVDLKKLKMQIQK